jgi:AraC family transcriptional regulator
MDRGERPAPGRSTPNRGKPVGVQLVVANMLRRVTPLFETPLLTVGEFRCPPGDAAWQEPNLIGDHPHVVFPRIPVIIQHAGHPPVLATPNQTMLYNGGQLYRRELRDTGGDNCVYIELPEQSLALLAEEGAALVDGNNRIVASHAPAGPQTYFRQHLLVRHLHAPDPDPLLAEETAAALVVEALGRRTRSGASGRRRTRNAHRELAEAAKTELTAAFGRNLGLQELAQRLYTSAFHLARVFRSETGFSLHGFRQSLRLRAALDRLSSNSVDLSCLALELGFSSHSHFTERFRNEFGVAPSQVRDERQIRTLLEVAARS